MNATCKAYHPQHIYVHVYLTFIPCVNAFHDLKLAIDHGGSIVAAQMVSTAAPPSRSA
jgi:hypothetical protein